MKPTPKLVTYCAFAARPHKSHGQGCAKRFHSMAACDCFKAFDGTRITIEGRDGQDCERRAKAICRDYRLPIRATLATLRRVRHPMI